MVRKKVSKKRVAKKKVVKAPTFVYIGYGEYFPMIDKWGYRFILDGDAVEVDDTEVAGRLRLHPHFKEV